eukprot:g2749.t1
MTTRSTSSALLASMGMGADARKAERKNKPLTSQSWNDEEKFERFMRAREAKFGKGGTSTDEKPIGKPSYDSSSKSESKRAESKWDENRDPQTAYQSLSSENRRHLETLSKFSSKIEKTGPAKKTTVKFGDTIKLHVNWKAFEREARECSVRWEKAKETDHLQFIEFVVDLLPDMDTVSAKHWDVFAAKISGFNTRLECRHLPNSLGSAWALRVVC